MIDETVYVAGTRFGLGLKPQDAQRASGNVQQWLMGQIESPQMLGEGWAVLPSSSRQMASLLKTRQEIKQGDAADKTDERKMLRADLKDAFVDEMSAKLRQAILTDTPFYERLVDFWSNHFTVSMKKGQLAGLVGPYEREAIRPHVTGRFVDMLLAVEHHPAMLIYLDNAQSIGPNSPAGLRRGKGLNENLAREIMELHTLGVNGGYSQEDVTTFAKVITGWGVGGLDSDAPGAFRFTPRRHEPGPQRILGKDYPEDGEEQGIAVLRDLAMHPATAQHIATKLARHFIADDPPQDAVERLAQVYRETGGQLQRIYDALLQIPQAWDVRSHPKIKSSYDLVVSAARAFEASDDKEILYCLQSLRFLGDMPFTASSPAGLPDTAQDIAGPEAMIRRVQWAQAAAVKLGPTRRAVELAGFTVGPILSDATRNAITGARQEREAVAILLGSPEFQRR